jgi:hypothetical protein
LDIDSARAKRKLVNQETLSWVTSATSSFPSAIDLTLDILHKANVGPMWMQDERVAAQVAEILSGLDGKAYRLDVLNHVEPCSCCFQAIISETNLKEAKDQYGHPIFVSEFPSLARIMQLLKGRSARECNLVF